VVKIDSIQEQLLTEMLAVNPDRRPEVKDILEHSWISPKAESTIDKNSTKAKIKSLNKKVQKHATKLNLI
jgi:serine/threonine protein kinase